MSKEKGGNLCNTEKNGTRDRDWLDCKQPGQRSHARRSFQKLSWEKSVFVSETFHAFSTYMFLRATNWFALWPFQDQIIRFGGDTDPSLPWPDHHSANNDTSMEKSLGSAMGSNAETLTLTPWNNRVWMELCIRPCRHHCIVRGNFRPKLTQGAMEFCRSTCHCLSWGWSRKRHLFALFKCTLHYLHVSFYSRCCSGTCLEENTKGQRHTVSRYRRLMIDTLGL